MSWFSEQPANNRLFIVGNHDTCFEQEYDTLVKSIPDGIYFIENMKIVLSHWENDYWSKINEESIDEKWFILYLRRFALRHCLCEWEIWREI